MAKLTKRERLELVFEALEKQTPFSSFEEAYHALTKIMNTIENRYSDAEFKVDYSNFLDRMYPPLFDNQFYFNGKTDFIGFRNRSDVRTVISLSGAIFIYRKPKYKLFSKIANNGEEITF